jgi:hypothetical protein
MITAFKPRFRPFQAVANVDAAEALALRALAYVVEEPERAQRFLQLTGLEGSELAGQLDNAAFLGGVLDFVLEDETLLNSVAAHTDLPPEAIRLARRQLPGSATED